MRYEELETTKEDARNLADLRVESMRESLTAIGRFDPERARERFLSSFEPKNTSKIVVGGKLAGFIVTEIQKDHIFLSHLYLHPEYQGSGIGGELLGKIKQQGQARQLPIRLGALRESRSNQFYERHDFRKIHEDEWDIYYEFVPS